MSERSGEPNFRLPAPLFYGPVGTGGADLTVPIYSRPIFVDKGGVLDQALQLENQKQLLKRYYQGRQMESPNGGHLIRLGVLPDEDGGAVAIFECSVSSLRYELPIPKATRTERQKVKEALESGRDPSCPRHGSGHALVRSGKDLVCKACGVAYGKA
ncbi:MAG: hypothetical protein U5R14_13455 [Gemmatimonadota bacterium]|nr:hypothetical protein [Gemmatimonadota bacterium]